MKKLVEITAEVTIPVLMEVVETGSGYGMPDPRAALLQVLPEGSKVGYTVTVGRLAE